MDENQTNTPSHANSEHEEGKTSHHGHRGDTRGQNRSSHSSETRPPLDTIYVGKKPPMTYVLAVVTQLNQGSNHVNLKARGRAISSAVDISQIVKHKFIPDLKITLGDVTTEDLASEDGSMRRVSSLTLVLSK